MNKPPKITRRSIVASTRIFTVEEIDLEFSNGNKRTYERLLAGRNGAVMVVPMLDANTMLLIREYAGGLDQYHLAFPKGLIEQGESPEQAANRELQEEAGYAAKRLSQMKPITLAPGYLSHSMHVVLAEDLYPATLEGDEPEPIEVVPWELSKIDELLAREEFNEARSIAALMLISRMKNS